MQVALVVGHAHATIKHSTLRSLKLLLTQPLQSDGVTADAAPVLSVDNMGAGPGDRVMLTTDGAAIRDLFGIQNSPIRWAVLGIVDGQSCETNNRG
ncbi:MAG: EutN/CcmL family microcompartment protein [Pirellulaceae bacterium]|nr:EutN/CcmL family microcompartment protein [Pirellulaceae bacterium]